MKTHWFKLMCGRNPETCGHRREDKCENPVSDCLLFEMMEDDARDYKEEIDIDE